MSESAEDGREEGELEARSAWLEVSDALLRGVGHALNNRVAALSAVAQVLAGSGEGGALREALSAETDRLQKVVELLRLLPHRWESAAEAARVDDPVRAAMELLPLHYELPELRYRWEGSTDLPPVLVEPSLLTHIFCLVGTAAAEMADATGASEVVFRGSSSGDVVEVTVSPGEGDEAIGALRVQLRGEAQSGTDAAAAAALVAKAGGELRIERGAGAFVATVSLPTLAAARRREQP